MGLGSGSWARGAGEVYTASIWVYIPPIYGALFRQSRVIDSRSHPGPSPSFPSPLSLLSPLSPISSPSLFSALSLCSSNSSLSPLSLHSPLVPPSFLYRTVTGGRRVCREYTATGGRVRATRRSLACHRRCGGCCGWWWGGAGGGGVSAGGRLSCLSLALRCPQRGGRLPLREGELSSRELSSTLIMSELWS